LRLLGFLSLDKRIQVQMDGQLRMTYMCIGGRSLAVLLVSFVVVVLVVRHVAGVDIVHVRPLLIAVADDWCLVFLLDAELGFTLPEHRSGRSSLSLRKFLRLRADVVLVQERIRNRFVNPSIRFAQDVIAAQMAHVQVDLLVVFRENLTEIRLINGLQNQ